MILVENRGPEPKEGKPRASGDDPESLQAAGLRPL